MQYAASIASAGVIVIIIAYTVQQVNKAAAQPPVPQVRTAPTCITALNTLSYRAQVPTKYEEIVDGCISAVPADNK